MENITDNKNVAGRELVTVRVINAPRERVWEAFTDPEQLAEWWGPNGFTNTIEEMDVREGGAWKMVMHGPDGTDYPNASTYTEVVKPERLSYSHGGLGERLEGFQFTITFEDEGGRTKITLRAVFQSPEELEKQKKFGAKEGGEQTLARLEEFLSRSK